MMTATVVLPVLIGVPMLLRFVGFAEPIAAILGAIAALCLVTSFDTNTLLGVLDFNRIDYIYLTIMVLTVIAALLAGCHPAPRANRPLGWYARGDAAFIGALLVATVLAGLSFQVSIASMMVTALTIGVALWLGMAGAGALLGRGSKTPPPVVSLPQRFGIGLLAVGLIALPSIWMMLLGLMIPSEAFAFLGLPAALTLRLVVGLTQGRGIAGVGTDLLRGIADGAWIILTAFAAQVAGFAYTMSGAASTAVALSPMWLMPALAIAVLALGVIVGPTYGAVLAVLVAAPLAAMAGVPPDGCALVVAVALMLGYARPVFGLSLLSPASGAAAQRPAAEVATMAVGAVIVVVVAAGLSLLGGGG